MDTAVKVLKYQLHSTKWQTFYCFAVIGLNILVSFAVTQYIAHTGGTSTTAGSIDATAIIWIFIIGAAYFKMNFNFLISNGFSRKQFFKGSLLSYIALAAIWSGLTTFMIVFGKSITSIYVFYDSLYRTNNAALIFSWFFAVLLFMVTFGGVISLVYYRASLRMKWLISVVFFAISPIVLIFSAITGGDLANVFGKLCLTILGLNSAQPNALIAVFALLSLTAVLSLGYWQLLKRTPVKA